MRLIDADALKEKFKERSYWTYTHEYGDAIPIGWIMSGIDNAPTVERPQGECGKCDYRKFTETFIDGVVEVMNKNGITSLEQLSEILKGGAE